MSVVTKTQFEALFEHKLSDKEMRDMLVALYERGETAQEIADASAVMRAHAKTLPIDESFANTLIDNCGTGGDKSGSFNISTTVSIVLASLGCYVAKHGNRSITSKSGSADVLQELGVNLDLDVSQQVSMLKACGFTFMFAVNHHPAMAFIMPVRKSLAHRTIFNILGPLTNPAGVKKQLIGVFNKNFVPLVAQALKINGAVRAMVVSSEDGMDEISISTVTHAAILKDGAIEQTIIDPKEYGFDYAPLSEILGGDAKQNAAILKGILDGSIQGAKRDIVLLNSAAALFVDQKASSIDEAIAMARQAIDSGKAIKQLEKIIQTSKEV